MEMVNYLAGFWGISMIIISLVFLMKPKNIQILFAFMEDEKNLVVMGVVNIMLGVALLLAYNTLDFTWASIITMLAWLILLRGICMMLFTDTMKNILSQFRMNAEAIMMPIFLITTFLGCFLTYAAFSF